MSEIVTSLLKAIAGLLFNYARDSAAKKLKEGDVMDKKIRELILREINDINLKLDALSRKDLLTAIDAFQAGVKYLCQALRIDYNTVRLAFSTNETPVNETDAPALTSAIEPKIKDISLTEFDTEAKSSLSQGKDRFKMAREEATKAFNNEALDTLHRITAIRYRVMAAMFESVTESLAVTKDLSSLSLQSALQSATPECHQSLQQLHSLPNVEKNFEVELRSGLFKIRRLIRRNARRAIISAVCRVQRSVYDALEANFHDQIDFGTIKIGEQSINPLCNRKVAEVLKNVGLQHCCVEWLLGHNGEEQHRLKYPKRIATNGSGDFLAVDGSDGTIKVFDSSGEFIYTIHPQVNDTVTPYSLSDIAADVNGNTYILVSLSEHETERREVQVFTKTEISTKFRVNDLSSLLTVSHGRVFVKEERKDEIYVYKCDGRFIFSFGERLLQDVIDIAAGSDGQIFVLQENQFVRVFNKDGYHQEGFTVNRGEDHVYSRLACHPRGEYIVFAGYQRETYRVKLAIHTNAGLFNRTVTLDEQLGKECFIYGTTVSNLGRVAVSVKNEDCKGKVIVL